MLQQTQVERVISKYKSFFKKFPSVRALSYAPLSAVLREWQGLGYNRRAKMLRLAAKVIVSEYRGKFPKGKDELLALPGIGPYTAGAVRVFAWNEPEILIETNVRTVFLHHFFQKKIRVDDSALVPYMELGLDTKNPKKWYSALMDYGAHLKKTVVNPSRKSAHHAKQKPFRGSDREIRGAIIKKLAKRASSENELFALGFSKKKIRTQLQALSLEGLIMLHGTRYTLHD